MKQQSSRWLLILFFFLAAAVSAYLSVSLHNERGTFNWKSELWSDRAGYYIYLPATLYYGWEFSRFPENMDEKTGYGFYYEKDRQKVRTKYTYGVAFLMSPFFVATHYITRIAGIPQDWAFAPIYHRATGVSAAVYLALGLMFLYFFLRKYFSCTASLVAVLFIYAGTNLFYYTVFDPLMSHVYSFFLVSLFLFSLKLFIERGFQLKHFLIPAAALSLAAVIRPTTLVLVSAFFLLDVRDAAGLKERFRNMIKPAVIGIFILIYLLAWLPQMAYYHYLTGSWFAQSYDQESFTNLTNPRFPELWFSTLNGLFTYVPLLIVAFGGLFMMIRRKEANSWYILGLFFVLSYVFSSWWSWYYGCSFGQRSFVEYLPVFAVPLAFLVQRALQPGRKAMMVLAAVLLLACTWFNIRLTYAFESCFFGSSWDWQHYTLQLNRAGIWPVEPGFSYKNDFENNAINAGTATTRRVSRSGDLSALLDAGHEYSGTFMNYPEKMKAGGMPSKVQVKLWVYKTGSAPTGGLVVCDISKDGRTLYWESRTLDVPMSASRSWFAVPVNFDLPQRLDSWSELRVYVWNKGRTTFYVDDMTITAQ